MQENFTTLLVVIILLLTLIVLIVVGICVALFVWKKRYEEGDSESSPVKVSDGKSKAAALTVVAQPIQTNPPRMSYTYNEPPQVLGVGQPVIMADKLNLPVEVND